MQTNEWYSQWVTITHLGIGLGNNEPKWGNNTGMKNKQIILVAAVLVGDIGNVNVGVEERKIFLFPSGVFPDSLCERDVNGWWLPSGTRSATLTDTTTSKRNIALVPHSEISLQIWKICTPFSLHYWVLQTSPERSYLEIYGVSLGKSKSSHQCLLTPDCCMVLQ